MRTLQMIGGAALAALGLAPALAQRPATDAEIEARHSAAFDRCLNSGEALQGVTTAMRQCNSDELARQDARLNAAYRAAMQRVPPTRQTALRVSERAWVAARDRNCRAEAAREGGGGSMTAVVLGGCLISETISRTIWLERYK